MALSLAELTIPKTTDEVVEQLLGVLQGRGVVTKAGSGTGSLSTSGTPTAVASVVVKIATAGELGTAQFQRSLDGGQTFGASTAVPASGSVALEGTAVTLLFAAGPVGAGTSFALGDEFAFEFSVPTFPVTSWRQGDVARTLVEIDAEALSNLGTLVAAIAKGGFLRSASGSWLTLLAREVYAVERNPAVATKGSVVLTDAASAGPFTLAPGQIRVASGSGLRFQSTNLTQLTLPQGGSLTITVQAEQPGAAYNVANGTITSLLSVLPGVTVNNPDPGSGTWVTTQGVDEESDAALVSRCEARWPESGYGSPAASYDLWARTASPSITRTKVQASGTVGGQVDVYVAGPSGPVVGGDVALAQAYITPRAPLTSTPVVASAAALAVTVTATLFGKAQYEAAAKLAAAAALEEFFRSLPIGGTVYRNAVIAVLQKGTAANPVTGVENVTLTAPTSDAVLTTAQVATLTLSPIAWTNT